MRSKSAESASTRSKSMANVMWGAELMAAILRSYSPPGALGFRRRLWYSNRGARAAVVFAARDSKLPDRLQPCAQLGCYDSFAVVRFADATFACRRSAEHWPIMP